MIKRSDGVYIEINDGFRGRATERDAIQAIGLIHFKDDLSKIEKECPSTILKVKTTPPLVDYGLEIGYTYNALYIKRNEDKLELAIKPPSIAKYLFSQQSKGILEPLKAEFIISWKPDELHLSSYWFPIYALPTESKRNYSSKIVNAAGLRVVNYIPVSPHTPGVEKTVSWAPLTRKTETTFPPNSLIEWARKENILPQTTYAKLEDFVQTVTSAFQSIPDMVETTGMQEAFWDATSENNKITSKRPKREPDIHPTIQGLLFNIATAKNLHITKDYDIAGGRLDFLVTGTLDTGRNVHLCAEFKMAHVPSSELRHGFEVQLPKYMRAKGCDHGLYCVMWFKGKHFDKPEKYESLLKFNEFINEISRAMPSNNIRPLVFDFSHPKPPSKS